MVVAPNIIVAWWQLGEVQIRQDGMCKLEWNLKFLQKLYEYISERLVSPCESFHCKAFVSKNILMPKFYVLCPHFSNHLRYSLSLPACFPIGRFYFLFVLAPQEQNLELILVMLYYFGNSKWFENCSLSFQW